MPSAAPKTKYILHAPGDPRTKLGEFTGASINAAARKAASRGVKDIHLRKPGSNIVKVYTGKRTKLATPVSIERNGKTIMFKHKTSVHFKRSYSTTD